MGTTKDVKQLIRYLKKQKIPVQPLRNHLAVVCPNGETVTIATTPGNWRTLRNAKADLKRNGINLNTGKRAA